MDRDPARDEDDLATHLRERLRRLGIEPSTLPAPPDDAPTPPRSWNETDHDRDDEE